MPVDMDKVNQKFCEQRDAWKGMLDSMTLEGELRIEGDYYRVGVLSYPNTLQLFGIGEMMEQAGFAEKKVSITITVLEDD